MEFIQRIYKRGWKYVVSGIFTFLLDMLIIFTLVELTSIPYWLAVVMGFLPAVSLNYYICYHWVYSGTKRIFHHGYFYFILLAFLGVSIITLGTSLLVEVFDLPLFVARTIMGTVGGSIGFFINSHFNFKLL